MVCLGVSNLLSMDNDFETWSNATLISRFMEPIEADGEKRQ